MLMTASDDKLVLGAALVSSPGGGGELLDLFLLGIKLFLLGVPALLQNSGPECSGETVLENCGFHGRKIPWPSLDSFRVLSVLTVPSESVRVRAAVVVLFA
jgi:hypothetical protein